MTCGEKNRNIGGNLGVKITQKGVKIETFFLGVKIETFFLDKNVFFSL